MLYHRLIGGLITLGTVLAATVLALAAVFVGTGG
jgi:hypothetical protein